MSKQPVSLVSSLITFVSGALLVATSGIAIASLLPSLSTNTALEQHPSVNQVNIATIAH